MTEMMIKMLRQLKGTDIVQLFCRRMNKDTEKRDKIVQHNVHANNHQRLQDIVFDENNTLSFA